MRTTRRKVFYLLLTGFLTSTAISAAYWQTNRYFESKARWALIKKELSKQNPDDLSSLTRQQKFAMKYVTVKGKLSDMAMMISRAREGRMGHLVVRTIEYKSKQGKDETILAVQGWIPQDYQYKPQIKSGQFKGILREKQKTDYIHSKMKATDLQRFNINTYIDIEQAEKQLNISGNNLYKDHYFQILKDLTHSQDSKPYPYQYSIDNFQLPYLTPDKHRAYAMFWSLTTMVGLGAIAKVIKMK